MYNSNLPKSPQGKKCLRCDEVKALIEFSKSETTDDRYMGICISCQRIMDEQKEDSMNFKSTRRSWRSPNLGIDPTKRRCKDCGEVKDKWAFHKWQHICKKCEWDGKYRRKSHVKDVWRRLDDMLDDHERRIANLERSREGK